MSTIERRSSADMPRSEVPRRRVCGAGRPKTAVTGTSWLPRLARARSREMKRSAAVCRSGRGGSDAGVDGAILPVRSVGSDAPNASGALSGTAGRGRGGRNGAGTGARSAGWGRLRVRIPRTSRSSSGITSRNATSSKDSNDTEAPHSYRPAATVAYRIGGFDPSPSPWSAIASRIDESAWMFCIR